MRRVECVVVGGGLAGLAVAGRLGRLTGRDYSREAVRAHGRLLHRDGFRRVMDEMFRFGPGVYDLADEQTTLCRCEEVTVGEALAAIREGAAHVNEVKAWTRVGMGRCQGTHELITNPKFGAYSKVGHDQVAGIETPDDSTVRVRLKEPFAPFMTAWGDTYIVPAHILEGAADPNTHEFNTKSPVGTGPFRFGSRVAGDHLVLLANAGYHGAAPALDRVIFKYIPDLTVLYTQFKAGAVDVTGLQGISAEFYAEAKSLPGVTVHLHYTPAVEYVYVNHGNPKFKELAVRQAPYHAMDKRAIIDQVYYGLPKAVEGYLPATSWAYNAELPRHDYNPDRAKAILDEAGWKPGPDGIRAKGGLRLSFSNATTAGNKLREQTQALLQQNWRAIGVDMQINNMPAAVIWGEFYVKSKFETLLVGIQASVGDDPDCLNRIHSKYIAAKTGSGRNVSQYENPQVDRLLEDGVREIDRAKRRAIYQKLQEVIRADLAYLPIFSYVRIEGVKQGIVNYRPNPYTQVNNWNMHEWGWRA